MTIESEIQFSYEYEADGTNDVSHEKRESGIIRSMHNNEKMITNKKYTHF